MKWLEFFRVTDELGRLSLTNALLTASFLFHIFGPQSGYTTALFITCAACYSLKRFVKPSVAPTEKVEKEIEELKSRLSALTIKASILPKQKIF